MANNKGLPPSRIGFERTPKTPAGKTDNSKGRPFIIVAAIALSVGAVFAANSIFIPQVELGSGVADLPACVSDSVVNFDLQVQTTGTTIRALDITGLNADCNRKFLKVSLTSSTDSVLREITSARLTTATTLRLTPANPALDPNVVHGITLEVSDTAF